MKRLAPVVACSLIALAAPLRGQTPAQPDTTRPLRLPPVTVTVLRTPIQLERAPFAVSVVDRAQLQSGRPGLGLDEALRGVAGVQVDNRHNYALGERIAVRGFGARAQFGVRGIRVLVDGIPATFPDGQTSLSHVDFATLARVEVIRGPAAALYGNTAGGVIQLETLPPPVAPLSQAVGFMAGENGLRRLTSATGGQRGGASYQLSLSRLDYTGFREFSDAENRRLNARLGYAFGRSSVRLAASAVEYDALNPGSLSDSLLRVNRAQAFANNVRQRTGERGRQGQLGATWQREAAGGVLEVSGYGITRSVDNPIPAVVVDLERDVAGGRALFRSGDAAPLRWALGVESALQRDERRNFRNVRGERGDLTLDQRERVLNGAAFAEVVAAPAPRLTVVGAVRYDHFGFRVADRLVATGNPDDSGRRTLEAVSPSLGVSYAPGAAATVYANVATAFETPTTTELANRPSGAGGFNPDLQPQRTLSYEAGSKGRLGGAALYQLALFRADVRDALVPFEVPQSPGRQFFRNAGASVHRGAEAEVTVAPFRGARAHAAYTYTDARFRRYAQGGAGLEGKRVPGVAPHRLEVLLSHALPSGWFGALEGRYASRVPVDDANRFHSPSHLVTDLRVGVREARVGRVRAEPFVGIGNLFDVEYNSSVVVNAFGGRYFEPGPGRALHAGLSVRI